MKRMFRKRTVSLLAIMISVTMVSGCGNKKEDVEEIVEEIVVVDTISLTKDDFVVSGEFIGTISPYEAAYIMPFVSGEITQVAVELGQEIKEGEVLCKIDDEGAMLQLESANASYKTVEANRKQATGGSTILQEIQADSGIQQLEGQVDNAEISLASTKQQVSDLDNSLDNIDSIIDSALERVKATTIKYETALAIKKQKDELSMASLNKADYPITAQEVMSKWEEEIGKNEKAIRISEEMKIQDMGNLSSFIDSQIPEKKAIYKDAVSEPYPLVDNDVTPDGLEQLTDAAANADLQLKNAIKTNAQNAICIAAEQAGISDRSLTFEGLSALKDAIDQSSSTYQSAVSQKPMIEQNLKAGKSGIRQAEVALETLNSSLAANKQVTEISEMQVREETQAILDTQLEAAGVGVKSAQMQLDMYTLKSPIDGIVEAVNVTENAMAASGNIAFVISNKDSMTVTFYVSEAIRNSLVLGQPITIDKSGVTYTGTIMEIGAMVDQQRGLFQIKGNINASGADLLTGSNVIIFTDTYREEDTYTIPYDAVYYEGGESYLYVEEEGIAVKKNIVVGLYNDDMISILSGLESDATVITSWSPNLRDGIAVKVKGE